MTPNVPQTGFPSYGRTGPTIVSIVGESCLGTGIMACPRPASEVASSSCPLPLRIMLPYHPQLLRARRHRLGTIGGQSQRPPRLLLHLLNRRPGVIRL